MRAVLGCLLILALAGLAHAQSRKPGADRAILKTPTGTVENSFQYYPGTEALAKDEIRITACGTGVPPPPDKTVPNLETEFLKNGRWDVSDVEEPAFREFKKQHGLK